MKIRDQIAAIIERAQQFGGMESTSPHCLADDIIADLGFQAEYSNDGWLKRYNTSWQREVEG